jgi:hypothetical protein
MALLLSITSSQTSVYILLLCSCNRILPLK